MNQLQIFKNSDFGQVRVVKKSNQLWFGASDIAKALGYSNPRDAIVKHCSLDGVATYDIIDSLGRAQKMKFITEGNICRLFANSKLPNAKKFESWIFDDLVPSTLRNEGYLVIKKGDTPEVLTERSQRVLQASLERQAIENEELRIENKLKDELIAEMQPIVDYASEALDYGTSYSTNMIAKGLGLNGRKLNKRLHALGIQYKQGNTWLLYSKYENRGFTKLIPILVKTRNGKVYSMVKSKWTETGREFIHQMNRESKI